MGNNPILVAIDTPDVARAKEIATAVQPHVGGIKLGLEFFVANGAEGVKQVAAAGTPLFLDLKFHDIPNTVAKAIEATAGIACFMMTIHASGGAEMLRRAAAAADAVALKNGARPQIIGVTMLTSLDDEDAHAIGYIRSVEEQAKHLALEAKIHGLDGIVCSPHEVAAIRKLCGEDFTLVVPGIRPEGADAGDQKRTMTPREALEAGASYLVIGRPITQAPDMAAAAHAISQSLA